MPGLKRKAVVTAVVAAVVAGGGAAAIAARSPSPAEESNAIVTDAAKQLGVTPAKLRAALKQAMANRIDAAVADGRLTQEQAKELKERLQSADALPLFGPHPGLRGHHGGPGKLGPGNLGPGRIGHGLDAAATYLGLTQEQLRAQLRDGKTLAQVATAQGKTVDGLVDALVADAEKRLDAAVKAGRLTEARKQELVARLEEHVRALVNGERPERGMRGFGRRGPWS